MLESLSGFIIHLIQSANYIGVFALMLLNSAAIPIPSEITLPFAGFLANQGHLNLVLVMAFALLGDLTGAVIAYMVGFLLEEELLLRWVKRFGKIILLTEEDYLRGVKWIRKYGAPVVFVGKITPGIKSFISLAAGIADVKFHKFIISAALGSLVYVGIVTYFGYYLGSKWAILGGYFRKFELLIAVAVVLGILWYINYKLKLIKLPRMR